MAPPHTMLESCCGCGGAVLADGGSTVEFTDSRISYNYAVDGGGFCLRGAHLTLRNCLLEHDSSIVWGGAIYAEGYDALTTIEASDCIFRGNYSATAGVYYGWESDDSTLVAFRDCQFIDNFASWNSDGVSVIRPAANLTIDRCTFAGNGPGPAGAVRANRITDISNSIFTGTTGGPAVMRSGGTLHVDYCAFYHNGAGDVVGLSGFGIPDTVNANGDSCDAYHNIFLDPAFADTGADDYHLTSNSPCIDAGNPESPPDPDGTVADMGALYFSQLSVPDGRAYAARHYGLEQNFPNPFNAATEISFELSRAAAVDLAVFDLTGRRITTLAEGRWAAGKHSVTLDARELSSGVYIYRLLNGESTQSRKLVVLK